MYKIAHIITLLVLASCHNLKIDRSYPIDLEYRRQTRSNGNILKKTNNKKSNSKSQTSKERHNINLKYWNSALIVISENYTIASLNKELGLIATDLIGNTKVNILVGSDDIKVSAFIKNDDVFKMDILKSEHIRNKILEAVKK